MHGCLLVSPGWLTPNRRALIQDRVTGIQKRVCDYDVPSECHSDGALSIVLDLDEARVEQDRDECQGRALVVSRVMVTISYDPDSTRTSRCEA